MNDNLPAPTIKKQKPLWAAILIATYQIIIPAYTIYRIVKIIPYYVVAYETARDAGTYTEAETMIVGQWWILFLCYQIIGLLALYLFWYAPRRPRVEIHHPGTGAYNYFGRVLWIKNVEDGITYNAWAAYRKAKDYAMALSHRLGIAKTGPGPWRQPQGHEFPLFQENPDMTIWYCVRPGRAIRDRLRPAKLYVPKDSTITLSYWRNVIQALDILPDRRTVQRSECYVLTKALERGTIVNQNRIVEIEPESIIEMATTITTAAQANAEAAKAAQEYGKTINVEHLVAIRMGHLLTKLEQEGAEIPEPLRQIFPYHNAGRELPRSHKAEGSPARLIIEAVDKYLVARAADHPEQQQRAAASMQNTTITQARHLKLPDNLKLDASRPYIDLVALDQWALDLKQYLQRGARLDATGEETNIEHLGEIYG